MILESLKNSKFSKNVLSKEALLMIDGGKDVATQGHGGDTAKYSMSQFNNTAFYDRTTTGKDGFWEDSVSNRIHAGAEASWYTS